MSCIHNTVFNFSLREINIPIEIPVKKSASSCHDEEACSRIRHDPKSTQIYAFGRIRTKKYAQVKTIRFPLLLAFLRAG